jgi:4-hydroxy-tetrahydrodipicolinate synthase
MLQGSFPALITPFTANGDIDWVCFKNLIAWHIEQGSDGLVICGCTGEAATLSCEEQRALISVAVQEAKGNIPIIAGTSSNNTKIAISRTQAAKEVGADACLVIVPYYNKPTFTGCLAHFTAVAACGLPLIVYHHPGRTGICLSPAQLASLCQIQGIIGIKDASGNMSAAQEFMQLSSTPLFSGDDAPSIELIKAGAKGSISVIANIRPKEWKDCIHKALEGRLTEAEHIYTLLAEPIQSMSLEINPQCIKYAMSLEKRCSAFLRLPLVIPEQETQNKLKEVFPQDVFVSIGDTRI